MARVHEMDTRIKQAKLASKVNQQKRSHKLNGLIELWHEAYARNQQNGENQTLMPRNPN